MNLASNLALNAPSASLTPLAIEFNEAESGEAKEQDRSSIPSLWTYQSPLFKSLSIRAPPLIDVKSLSCWSCLILARLKVLPPQSANSGDYHRTDYFRAQCCQRHFRVESGFISRDTEGIDDEGGRESDHGCNRCGQAGNRDNERPGKHSSRVSQRLVCVESNVRQFGTHRLFNHSDRSM